MLKAPNNFKDVLTGRLLPDQEQALSNEFDRLRSDFHFAERRLKNERLSRIARELIEMSYEAYRTDEKKTATNILQECEGLIWPSMARRPKYAVAAELHVFGKNTLYEGIVVSEGGAADLGRNQAVPLALAERWVRSYQAENKEFQYFSWVVKQDGAVARTSVLPKEDEHPVLQPVQRSFGFKRLKELSDNRSIRACVLVDTSLSQTNGLTRFALEERGRPRVSAVQRFRRVSGEMRYEAIRYHLEDPVIFPAVSESGES
jgi:hypothetical protein